MDPQPGVNCLTPLLSLAQRREHAVPEPILWLTARGICWIASQQHDSIAEPKRNASGYHRRKLAKRLRELGMRYLDEPRWIQLSHDLNVVSFKLAVEAATAKSPVYSLLTWVNEGDFLADMDIIEYAYTGPDGVTRKLKKECFTSEGHIFVIAFPEVDIVYCTFPYGN